MKHFLRVISVVVAVFFISSTSGNAQTVFTHPGGLHSQTDLDRMKSKVTAGEHPWIDSWNILITDSRAQSTYSVAPRANMGGSRQRAQQDATAIYLNAVRWYVTGNTTYANAAVRMANAWSAAVNQVPTGTDIPGLIGIPISTFAIAGEVLRLYPGWATADFERYKNMFRNYLYPTCHDFLANHNGRCVDYYWANWDACNVMSLIAMGVLLDDSNIYNEGIEYFKNGAGSGSIKNAVTFIHPGGLGQWQESGRDQSHNMLGLGFLAYAAQIAGNQGEDLFGYDNNRMLAGAEYIIQANLMKPVPYRFYDNCDNVNNSVLSINALGRFDNKPIYELLYNHYVIKKGLSAPNVKVAADVVRPEHGDVDHLGYGTLMFTRDGSLSPYPAFPPPPAPTQISATAGVGRVFLKWVSGGDTTGGYEIKRSLTPSGPYTSIGSWIDNTFSGYTDTSVVNGTTYYYVVAARNRAGYSDNSSEVNSTPANAGAIPAGWVKKDIGTVITAGSASYANVSNNTFIISGSGTGLGGTTDSLSFTGGLVTGNTTVIGRIWSLSGTLQKTGLMMRESLSPDSKTLSVTIGDAGWRFVRMGVRSSTGGTLSFIDGNKFTWVPVWFKLERIGNTFKAYQSNYGIDWYEIYSAEVPMSQTFYAGLVACAGSSTGAVTTTGFDNVTVLGGGAAPTTASNLTATATGSRSIDLSWTASTDAASYVVKRATTTSGPYITIANGASNTNYSDTGLEWHTTYYYRISAANLVGESAYTNGASATTFNPPIPPTPLNLTAASGDTIVILTWNTSNDASTYNIKRASNFTGPYINLGTTSTTNYADVGLTNGVSYYYKVSAANYIGESEYSLAIGTKPYTNRIGYWAFNETSGKLAVDSWGGRNGTLASSASFTSGKAGNAVSLDGTANGYVQLPAGIMSGITNFTIATRVKMTTSSNWVRLFDFGSSTSLNMFLTTRNGANGYLRYAITNAGNSREQQINTSYTMPLGEWIHVAVTLSDTLGIIYINGVEAGRNANMTLNPSSLGNTINNYIGKSQYNDPLLNGLVDDFRFYNKALNTDEIVGLMSAPTYTAVVNHAPTINGTVEGSIHVLSAESINLNGNTVITGELLVPGSPKIIINGKPTLSEVLEGVGSASPDTHTITINGNTTLNCLMRRTDPTSIPALPETTGVQIKGIVVNAGESLILPAGTYGNVIINDQGTLTIDGTLTLTGGLTLNGGSTFFGKVVAPQGAVIINGNSILTGTVVADYLIINGNGLLK